MATNKLSKLSSRPPASLNKDKVKKETAKIKEKIIALQRILAAQKKYSLLVILQGIDASGKDGSTRKVFSGINPSGIDVYSFKKPTPEEFDHEFLWRVHKVAPAKGKIRIFNRSHYEDVLIQRVHKWIDMDTVHRRYKHINNFESLLQENGTTILKFYLHISKERQLEKLSARMVEPHKFWKHNPNDWKERQHWDKYMEAYEDCFRYCNKPVKWIFIPADVNWYKEHLIAKHTLAALEAMDLKYPPLKR